jgi:hypothetical protein
MKYMNELSNNVKKIIKIIGKQLKKENQISKSNLKLDLSIKKNNE